jgi:hypothetical protein
MSWEGETSKVVNLHHHSKYESKILKCTWTSSNPRRKSRWLLLRVIFIFFKTDVKEKDPTRIVKIPTPSKRLQT